MFKQPDNDQQNHLFGTGLSKSFVLQRQEDEGFNELPQSRPKKFLVIVYDVLKEPMVYLLLGCGFIYFLIGDQQEAVMLFIFLFLIIGITIAQEAKAERALEALKDLSSPRALVLRDGSKYRIAGKEIVREDIIFLSEGDRVPADAVVLSSQHLASDESLLTGESFPVEKNKNSMVFAGATVVRGQAIASVVAIGTHTELGKIGKSLGVANIDSTALEKQTSRLVKQTAWIAVLICTIVIVAYALTRNNWLQGILVGLSLAMAIMPNELPAVLTIFFALGAWRLSKRRVLTRKLSAIENLGAATILCVDKTGTLTLNKMTIQEIFSQGAQTDLSLYSSNLLEEEFHEVLEYGILASRKDPFDPMEKAFLEAGARFLIGTEHLHQDWLLSKEYPISAELLSITQAWKPRQKGGFIIGAKGAPEAIIDLCHLSGSLKEAMEKKAVDMASRGLRVLGVAKAFSPEVPLPEKQHDFEFEFLGFIGIMDPVRSEVPLSVSECHRAGIRVLMLTGDHPATASSIARKIGLINPDEAMTGEMLNNLSDIELAKIIQRISVFSRVMPSDKLRLVKCLQAAGEIVAMTGDGVNDAPALRKADIGIAMGGRGTDVAREAADIVLLDDDFASIVESIRMGRRIFCNLRSALIYLFAVHIPIAGMTIFPVFLGLPLVFFPAHIAFLHLIIEPASSVAFEMEPADSGIMTVSPRKKHELLGKKMWAESLLMGSSILAALLFIFYFSLQRGNAESDARTLVFTTLIVANITLILMSRNAGTRFLQKIKTRPNQAIKFIIPISVLMLAAVLFNEKLRILFNFSLLHVFDLIFCLFAGVISVIWIDFIPRKG